MYWSMGGFVLISASILLVGLSDVVHGSHKHATLYVTIREGILAAKNPRIVLSYLASFAARGDSIIITSFLTLWIQQYYTSKGHSKEEALLKAGTLSGIAQSCAIVASVFAGLMADFMSHTLAQSIVAFIAMGGYIWLFFVSEPTGWMVYLAVCIVGVGEIGMIVISQVVVAASAPKNSRGSVSGFFSLCGSIGILICSLGSGALFDKWNPRGPFLLVGLFNAVVFVFGIGLYIFERRRGL
eukprot:TRINITY_DN4614_c0_g2_i2.p1 TRINITY_DN4614_c0_g2~~TRINITY_DN4614_c0_g2_i2.p1  ORF type:complete len:241 (+),score=30.90 TRINITY_DN4614_c0_g2_i2:257-979(+)